MTATLTAQSFWPELLQTAKSPERVACIRQLMAEAESRRSLADYDTGSITEDEALALRALAEHFGSSHVIEVGTFIGTSTMAIASASTVQAVYTCDISNACLAGGGKVHAYPKRTSTQMLHELQARDVRADLCFFDGVLGCEDAELLVPVVFGQCVYAFHDFNYGPKIRKGGARVTVPRKGIGNVNLLKPRLPDHVLIEPFDGSTLALLVPGALL